MREPPPMNKIFVWGPCSSVRNGAVPFVLVRGRLFVVTGSYVNSFCLRLFLVRVHLVCAGPLYIGVGPVFNVRGRLGDPHYVKIVFITISFS